MLSKSLLKFWKDIAHVFSIRLKVGKYRILPDILPLVCVLEELAETVVDLLQLTYDDEARVEMIEPQSEECLKYLRIAGDQAS